MWWGTDEGGTLDWGEGEVTALMTIFLRYSQEVREEALERGIKVNVLSTEDDKVRNVYLCVDRYMR